MNQSDIVIAQSCWTIGLSDGHHNLFRWKAEDRPNGHAQNNSHLFYQNGMLIMIAFLISSMTLVM
jgi:hypothetical protein